MTIHTPLPATTALLGVDHGLALGTPVLCLDGMMPVEYLHPGDHIITRSGARRLLAIEVTSLQNAEVIHISAGVLGVDRPEQDMVVPPDQPILIRDWRAKALTGAAVAMIPAARLVDGSYIRTEIVAELRFYTLRFEQDLVIYAGDLELACPRAPVTA